MKRIAPFFIVLLALFAIIGASVQSPNTVSVIIQSNSINSAITAVAQYGGEVQQELAIINGDLEEEAVGRALKQLDPVLDGLRQR
jgi:hypothetical protein